jgi:hypothetical protein
MQKIRKHTQKGFFMLNVLKVINEEINHSCNSLKRAIIKPVLKKPSSCKTNGQTELVRRRSLVCNYNQARPRADRRTLLPKSGFCGSVSV